MDPPEEYRSCCSSGGFFCATELAGCPELSVDRFSRLVYDSNMTGLRRNSCGNSAGMFIRLKTEWKQKWGSDMRDQLTKNDIKKIEEEIEYRKLVVRKEAIEAVKEARAQGDLSENFEYYAAKKDKNKNESRIRYLERMLRTAVVVSDESKEDEVGINNTVPLYIEEDDETETYKLVTSIRGKSLEGKISTESPLGKAILGKKQGDRVLVRVNDNYGYYVVIKAIDKSTNDAEDDIRKF